MSRDTYITSSVCIVVRCANDLYIYLGLTQTQETQVFEDTQVMEEIYVCWASQNKKSQRPHGLGRCVSRVLSPYIEHLFRNK